MESTGHSPFKIISVQLLGVKKAHHQLTFNKGATKEEIIKALEIFRKTATELKVEHFDKMAERIAMNIRAVGKPFSTLEWEFTIISGNACLKVMKIVGNSAWHLDEVKVDLTIFVGEAQAQYNPPIDHFQEKIKYGGRRFGFIGPRSYEWAPVQRVRALDTDHINQLRRALEAKIPEIKRMIEDAQNVA